MAEGLRSKAKEREKSVNETETSKLADRRDQFKPTPPQASASALKKTQEKAEKEATLAAMRKVLSPKKVTPHGSPVTAKDSGDLSAAASGTQYLAENSAAAKGSSSTDVPLPPGPAPPLGPQGNVPAFPKLEVHGQEPGTTPGTEGRTDSVLAAIAALSARFDTLATKDDLTTLRTDLEKHTRDTVSAAVDPVRQEVQQLQARVRSLETADKAGTWKEKDRADPARKQVAVLGWPEQLEAGQRLEQLEKLVKEKLPDFRPVTYSNEYKGPYTNRRLGKAVYVHLATEDEARNLVKAAKDREVAPEVGGSKLRLVPAKTARFKQRDWALSKAEELLKESAEGRAVEVQKKERTVKVGGVVAFKQEKDDAKGNFVGSFSHLTLPA